MLAKPSETGSLLNKGAAEGVVGKLDFSNEKTPGGEPTVSFAARNTGDSPARRCMGMF